MPPKDSSKDRLCASLREKRSERQKFGARRGTGNRHLIWTIYPRSSNRTKLFPSRWIRRKFQLVYPYREVFTCAARTSFMPSGRRSVKRQVCLPWDASRSCLRSRTTSAAARQERIDCSMWQWMNSSTLTGIYTKANRPPRLYSSSANSTCAFWT